MHERRIRFVSSIPIDHIHTRLHLSRPSPPLLKFHRTCCPSFPPRASYCQHFSALLASTSDHSQLHCLFWSFIVAIHEVHSADLHTSDKYHPILPPTSILPRNFNTEDDRSLTLSQPSTSTTPASSFHQLLSVQVTELPTSAASSCTKITVLHKRTCYLQAALRCSPRR